MKILITGAKGFVGRNLTACLQLQKENQLFLYDIRTDSEEDATDVLDNFITEHFEVSSTESGKELQLMTDVVNGLVWEDLESEKASTKIYTNSGTTFNYEDSIFYRIELSLNPNFENSTGKVFFLGFQMKK